MPVYLMRFSYTPETWSRLIQNPEDRRDAARAYLDRVGGTLHGFWYGFGEYDGYAIFDAPDNVSVAGAVLAIAAGGTVTVQLESDGEWALARVTDTGEGIDSDAHPAIFEPFFTTKPHGNGLGLAASLEIARAHGSDLIALSSVGAGASFVLRLPIVETQ